MKTNWTLIEQVKSPNDLKELDDAELRALCQEIRTFLVDSVSKTGGHLASNLGVVELTVALMKFFRLPEDKIVWDVGHQSYVYKILTGRFKEFSTLRQFNGIAGFPKTAESVYDSFNTGHSSTSISAALGMARARDRMGRDYKVVAVIGDGAISGGMSLEALNDAGRAKTDIVVVLNDNQMSIGKNVGGISRYLRNLRINHRYRRFVKGTEGVLQAIPLLGKPIVKVVKKLKGLAKNILLPTTFFEQLGFKYYGPIDGHDIQSLCAAFLEATFIRGPVLLHVVTHKGKGYQFAEDNPDTFHGISSFDPETGEVVSKGEKTYSQVFGEEMIRFAQEKPELVAITAAMISGTGLGNFAKQFGSRVFDVGIAEQHAVTLAAGMAMQGLTPVVAVYSTFLQRAYDQLLHDIAFQKLHVVFALDRAGLVGQDGETHQGIYDLSYLMHLPGFTILSPCDYYEFRKMLDYAVNVCTTPVVVRFPRGVACEVLYTHHNPDILKPEMVSEGNDITLYALGRMVKAALKAAAELKGRGLSCEVINARIVKPFDDRLLVGSVQKTGRLVTMEDNAMVGGMGSMICQYLANQHMDVDIMNIAFPDTAIEHGDVNSLFEKYGLDTDSIVKKIVNRFERK